MPKNCKMLMKSWVKALHEDRSSQGSLSTKDHSPRRIALITNHSPRGSLATRSALHKAPLSARFAFTEDCSLRGSLSTGLSKRFAPLGSFSARIALNEVCSTLDLRLHTWLALYSPVSAIRSPQHNLPSLASTS